MPPAMRAVSRLRRLALNLLAALVGVLLIEAVLQVGALFLAPTRLAPDDWATPGEDGLRVLCIGDSNTYGLYLEPGEAWPRRLEEAWSSTDPDARVEVVNLAYPGTNSSQLRRDLPRMLDRVRPHLVLVLVGVNDFWTRPVALEDEVAQRRGVLAWVERNSRLYRLVWAVRRAFDAPEFERAPSAAEALRGPIENPHRIARGPVVEQLRYGGEEFERKLERGRLPGDRTRSELEANLRALAAEIRSFGAQGVLLTYPSRVGSYAAANGVIRAAAAHAEGTPLIDLAVGFRAVCPAEPCPEWLFVDHHPTAPASSWIGERLVQDLPALARRDLEATGDPEAR